MSTANKLSYLNDTKSLLRTSLNKFGSNILTTDTFRSYDTKLNEIYDKLPKITQSGAGFTLENVQNGQVDDFKMNGTDLEQDTTIGKNLCGIPNQTFNHNGVDVTIQDGEITLNGTCNSSTVKNIEPVVPIILNGDYTLNIIYIEGTLSGNTNFNIRKADNQEYINGIPLETQNKFKLLNFTSDTSVIYGLYATKGTVFSNFKMKIQLISGTEADYNFEPYTGGIASPNPNYPQEIKVVEGRQVITDKGKNLFDKDNANIITAYIGDSYNWTFSGSAICYRINCKPNTSYTISCANSNETIFRGSVTDSEDIPTSGNNLSIYSTVRRTNNSPITVNTGANAKYVLVQLSNTQYLTSLETLQVEEGSTATDYEPYYNPVSYNIDLHGKNIFDGQYEDGYYNMNGTKSSTQDPYGRRSTNLNKIEPNTNYSISINNNIISETIRLFYYDASRKFISTESISNGTFTSPAECYYVSWHSSSLKQNYPDGIPNMMIEQGQTVTTYEDYYDYKLAKMPNTIYKNKIYKNNGNWYFEKNIEKIVIDEKTSTPNINSSSNNTIRLLYSQLLSNNKSIADNPDIVSNYLIGKIMWNIDSEGIYSNNNDLVMRMNKSTVGNTLNSVLDWLSTHNVEIWYPLATPVTTQITNATLINQLESLYLHTGTNIITISNSNNIIPEIEITRLKELEKLS